MKSTITHILAAVLFVFCAVISSAQTTKIDSTGTNVDSSISPSVYYVAINDTVQISNPLTLPTAVIWTSSDPTIATVLQNGKVIGVQPGNVSIYITNVNGTVMLKWPVQVYKPTIDSTINDSSTVINPEPPIKLNEYTVKIGETINIQPGITIAIAYTWFTSNDTIATVDQKGNVTGIRIGDAIIYIGISNANALSKYLVHVIDTVNYNDTGKTITPEPPVYPNNYTIKIGETINIQPEATISIPYNWQTSENSIATIDQKGNVTGIQAGNATIYLSLANDSILSKFEIFVIADTLKNNDSSTVNPDIQYVKLAIGEKYLLKSKDTDVFISSDSTIKALNSYEFIASKVGETIINEYDRFGSKVSIWDIFVYTNTIPVDTGIVVSPVDTTFFHYIKLAIGEKYKLSSNDSSYFISSDSTIKAKGSYTFVASQVGETEIIEFNNSGKQVKEFDFLVYTNTTTIDSGIVKLGNQGTQTVYLSVGDNSNLFNYINLPATSTIDWVSNGVIKPGLNGSFTAIADGYTKCIVNTNDSLKQQEYFVIYVSSNAAVGKDSLVRIIALPVISSLNFQYQNYTAIEKLDSNSLRVVFDKEITDIAEIEKNLNLSIQSPDTTLLKAGLGSLTITSVIIDPTNNKAIIITTKEVIQETASISVSYNNTTLLSTNGTTYNKINLTTSELTVVKSTKSATMLLYPTVATGTITVSAESIAAIEIFSSNGVLVDRITSDNSSQTIDISNYRPGTYILRLKTTKARTVTKRFIKL